MISKTHPVLKGIHSKKGIGKGRSLGLARFLIFGTGQSRILCLKMLACTLAVCLFTSNRAFSQETITDSTLTDSTLAYLTLQSSTPGYEAYLDGKLIGKTPFFYVSITAGQHTLLLRRTLSNSWMMTDWTKRFSVNAGDTVAFYAQLNRPYLVKSEPFGASVFLDGEFKGTTPLIIELPDTASFALTLIRDGYKPANLICDPAGSQFLSATLQPDRIFSAQQQEIYEQARIRKGRYSRNTLVFAGLTAVSGVAAILLNKKADDFYERYLQAGDPDEREHLFDQTEKYDTYSGIALGVFQVNVGISLYFLYKSLK